MPIFGTYAHKNEAKYIMQFVSYNEPNIYYTNSKTNSLTFPAAIDVPVVSNAVLAKVMPSGKMTENLFSHVGFLDCCCTH